MKNLTKLTFVLFAFFVASAFAQPKIDIDGGFTYDWGKIKPSDSPLKAKIKILNRGNEILKISEVKPGCGCTTAPLDKNDIEPNGFATLDVTLNVGSNTGDVAKSITIKCNDPEKGTTSLMLKANVFVPVTIFPRYLSFNKLYANEETIAKVILTNNIDKPIKFTKITSEPAELAINIKEGLVLKPKESLPIEAKINPSQPGRLAAKITIETDNKEMPTIEITGWGNIVTKESDAPVADPSPKK